MSLLAFIVGLLFLGGYAIIIFEGTFRIDKAAAALLTGVLCWAVYLAGGGEALSWKLEALHHHLSDISQVLFFLIGAMLIVEVIDAHQGFTVVGRWLGSGSPLRLFWSVMLWGFFLSSLLDNLTTIIVMLCMLRKLLPERSERLIYCAGLVGAVNAGGAWTPIGDITTTMLWMSDCITTMGIIKSLFLPSLAFFAVLGVLLSLQLPKSLHCGDLSGTEPPVAGKIVSSVGIGALLAVPVLKALIGLPPFMGILLGLGVLWVITDLAHLSSGERKHLRIYSMFSKIDLGVVMFFLGILLAVDALQAIGILGMMATALDSVVGSPGYIAVIIGLLSAVIDNVPLVAACIKMYPLEQFALDHEMWKLIAYCAGTGGSVLLIGSAPGVALMSLESVDFQWYLKRVSLAALVAYFSGIGVYYVVA